MICGQFYWQPDRPVDDILAEYAAGYFGPDSAADAVRLFHLMEKTHRGRTGASSTLKRLTMPGRWPRPSTGG